MEDTMKPRLEYSQPFATRLSDEQKDVVEAAISELSEIGVSGFRWDPEPAGIDHSELVITADPQTRHTIADFTWWVDNAVRSLNTQLAVTS